tara:strand:- start:1421 stop:2728 length:1308 start_codon:yes stop_codon:yes gene_type:complete
MSVPISQRSKWHRRKKITKNGVDFWEYKYIDWKGNTTKRKLTNKDVGSRKSNLANTSTYFAVDLNSSYDFGKAFKDNEGVRNYLYKTSPNGAKIQEYYENYGSKGSAGVPEISDLKAIKANASDEDWKLFVQYGLGVKEDKVDKWTKGSAAFSELITKTSEEIEEWGKSADFESWYDEGTDIEGEPKRLKSEEEIRSQEDPRMAMIDSWDISDDQKQLFREKLRGTQGTGQIPTDSIIGREIKAREDYRKAIEGEGGYDDTLEQLVADKAEEMETLNISKESSLDDILKNYMGQSDEYQDVYGQQVSDIKSEEDIMRSKTGLSRQEEDISDLVKGYEDDYTKRIEDYRQQTGATQKDVAEGLRTAQTAYEQGVDETQNILDFAFQDFQDSLGGGEAFGTSFLEDLTEGYWQTLQGEIDDLYSSDNIDDIATWFDT